MSRRAHGAPAQRKWRHETPLIATVFTAIGIAALVQPVSACAAGYEPAWIQGNMVCTTCAKLPLKPRKYS